ncbi:hypothetical protein BWI97_01935 [Siphonobacter sp. BAB-5405]|nr:hypothetical protein BWI97_01935 [Siphonobacter sp. BAB-5405]
MGAPVASTTVGSASFDADTEDSVFFVSHDQNSPMRSPANRYFFTMDFKLGDKTGGKLLKIYDILSVDMISK